MKEEQTKEWAIANKKITLKHNGGVWTPDGEFLEVPNGITRYQREIGHPAGGWDVYYFDDNLEYKHTRIKDSACCGNFKLSLQQAIELYKKNSKFPLLKGRTSHVAKEYRHKETRVQIPGIRFSENFSKKRNQLTYIFTISVGKDRKTIYVGTKETWEANYEAKYAQAVLEHSKMKEKRFNELAFA